MFTMSGLTRAFVFAFAAFLEFVAVGQQPQLEISGVVVDSRQGPLANVDVVVFLAGNSDPTASVTSGKDGGYSVRFAAHGPFDVAFAHTRYDIAIVQGLVGIRQQVICKMLYARGEKRPVEAVDDYIASRERMIFQTASIPRDRRSRYDEFFSRFEISPFKLEATLPEISDQSTPESRSLVDIRWKELPRLLSIVQGR